MSSVYNAVTQTRCKGLENVGELLHSTIRINLSSHIKRSNVESKFNKQKLTLY